MKRKPQIKKSRWLPPYVKPGKTTFNEVRKRSGVYFIKKDGQIVYVGYSRTQLYKTLYRHFQAWKHPFQTVITYKGEDLKRFEVRVILCSPARAERLETYFIKKLKPIDNPDKLKQLEITAIMKRDAATIARTQESQVDYDNPF